MDNSEPKTFPLTEFLAGSKNVKISIILGLLCVVFYFIYVLFLGKSTSLFDVVVIFIGGATVASGFKICVIAFNSELHQKYGETTSITMFLGGLVLIIVSIGGIYQAITL